MNEKPESHTEETRDGATPVEHAEGEASTRNDSDPVGEKPETRDEEMERLRAEASEADKRVLMAQAEAENFRKRMRRDLEDQLKYASVSLVEDLLQVRDNLCRALDAAEQATDASGLKEGVAMVAKQLDETLGKYGVREIPAAGELFDPNFHEAISQMPSDEHTEGMVAHVHQTGFQMHDRVIRPSQVVVSTGPNQAGE